MTHPRNLAIVISERIINIRQCLEFISLKSSYDKIVVISPHELPTDLIAKAALIHFTSDHHTTLAYILNNHSANDLTFFFCDNAMSMLTEKVIAFLRSYETHLNINRLSFLPAPLHQKNCKDYLIFGVGNRSLLGATKRLLKVLSRNIYNTSFKFCSFSNDKTTYICPDFSPLGHVYTASVLPSLEYPSSPKAGICFLHGNESHDLFFAKEFAEVLKYLSTKCKVYIKLHPRASQSSRNLIQSRISKYCNIFPTDNGNSLIPNLSIGMSIASSSLFTFPFTHRISLSKLFSKFLSNAGENKTCAYIYHKELSDFFGIEGVTFPSNVSELSAILEAINEVK